MASWAHLSEETQTSRRSVWWLLASTLLWCESELQHPSTVAVYMLLRIISSWREQNERRLTFMFVFQYFFARSDFMDRFCVSETAAHNITLFANFSLFSIPIDSGKAVIYVIKRSRPLFNFAKNTSRLYIKRKTLFSSFRHRLNSTRSSQPA